MKKYKKSTEVRKADREFSKYIRGSYADANGYVRCFTCGVRKPIAEMHCGHFQPRSREVTRWDENNARPQCPSCNLYYQGRQYEFGKLLERQIGQKKVERLIALAHTSIKLSVVEVHEIYLKYKKLNGGG